MLFNTTITTLSRIISTWPFCFFCFFAELRWMDGQVCREQPPVCLFIPVLIPSHPIHLVLCISSNNNNIQHRWRSREWGGVGHQGLQVRLRVFWFLQDQGSTTVLLHNNNGQYYPYWTQKWTKSSTWPPSRTRATADLLSPHSHYSTVMTVITLWYALSLRVAVKQQPAPPFPNPTVLELCKL